MLDALFPLLGMASASPWLVTVPDVSTQLLMD